MPRTDRRHLTMLDAHYGGDVSRVVMAGAFHVPGRSTRDKRDWLQEHGDGLRRLLLYPPYGDPSMCVNLIVDAETPAAPFGYIIMEAMGYPHFSGSNSICVVTALLETGRIPLGPPGDQEVLLEAPVGPVRAVAHHDGSEVHRVTLDADPAWVAARGLVAELPTYGRVTYDLVWSGCYYAVVDADAHGFAVSRAERAALAGFGNELCLTATHDLDLVHPTLGDTGPLSFVSFAGNLASGVEDGHLQAAAATYVHPGVVCACPTGTGTVARLALLEADGLLAPDDELVTISPTGSRMTGRITGTDQVDGHHGVRATVSGRAFTLGRLELVVNRDDELVDLASVWDLLQES
jgi:proline racemase